MDKLVTGLIRDGLYRVEKDADGVLWGCFSPEYEGMPPTWQILEGGTALEKALESVGMYTAPVMAYGAIGGGV